MKNKLLYLFITLMMIGLILTACGGNDKETPAGKGTEAMSEEAAMTPPKEDDKSDPDNNTKAETADAVASDKTVRYPDSDYAKSIDSAISGYTYFKTRSNDKESGDLIDLSVYKDSVGNVVKLINEDYGSDGRMVTEYYFSNGEVVYIKQYKTDIYGANDEFTEGTVSEELSDYLKEEGKKLLSSASGANGTALLYGYVGDEQGGITADVKVDLRNVAGTVNMTTTTNDDGFYTVEVPQTEDTYNLTYTYGENMVSSLNDVHIVPGTSEYSLGKVYTAPAGHAIHDTDVYLMNASLKPLEKLDDDEYMALLTSEYTTMTLKLVDKEDHERETGNQIKFEYDDSKNGYALYAEDTANIGKDDMNGNIGTSNANVVIFDKNGIVAAFVAPAGRLGSLWKICDIDEKGNISMSGILYTDTKGWK